MKRYELRPLHNILIDGTEYTPDDVLATVESALPSVRDVLSMVQFGGACIVDPDAEAEESDEELEEIVDDEDDEPAGDFAGYSAKVQAGLAEAGIANLAQAALYLRDNKSFEPLEGIGRVTSKQIVAQIEAAGLPVSD